MSEVSRMELAVDRLLEGDMETAKQFMLTENAEDSIVRRLGEVTLLNYLMKFEEYLDNHSLYLFDGWEHAQIIAKPKIEKFWTRFYLRVPKNTQLKGAQRICNDKEGQNTVQVKRLEDGTYVVRFKILKRYLDQIEVQNKEKAEQLSQEEITSDADQ